MSVKIHEGRVSVTADDVTVLSQHEDIALLHIDSSSKYYEVIGFLGGGSPGVILSATDYTLDENKNAPEDSDTCVEFCDFGAEWMVVAANASKHCTYVTLWKP